jgi:hypothetical protein
MSEDDKCNVCGAVLKMGLRLVGPQPAPRCALCGASLAMAAPEQPYTIEFASDQRAQRHPENVGEGPIPALGAGTVIAPDVFWTPATQEGESP